MSKITFPALAIMLLVTGCLGAHTQVNGKPAYTAHQYTSHDVEILWNTERTPGGLSIAGTVTNPRYNFSYDSFQLTTELLDARGKVLAKGSQDLPDSLKGPAVFRMDIPTDQKDQVKRIRFSYSFEREEDHFLRHFESEP